MCTKYRYCSPMSCTGQSAATQSRMMPNANHRFCAAVTAGCPGATTFGPMTRAAYT